MVTTQAGTLKYLPVTSGNYSPGLYYFDGQSFQKVVSTGDITALYPPITLVEGSGIRFTWDSAKTKLTISTA